MYKGLSTVIELGRQYSGLIPIKVSGKNPNGDPTFFDCRCFRCGEIIKEVHYLDIAWYRIRCCRKCDDDDLTGMRFGKLIAIRRYDCEVENGRKRPLWLCKCDCGNEKIIRRDSLLLGMTSSCGCIKNYNIIGRKFGKLTVLKEIGVTADHTKRLFYCKCECGTTIIAEKGNLVNGHTTSCGRCSRVLDLAGKRFGRLIAVRLHPYLMKHTNRVWECKCDCGKTTFVTSHDLSSGHTKSCGCLSDLNRLYKTEDEERLANVFTGMKRRCYKTTDHAFKHYGGRGIAICDEWLLDKRKFIDWALTHGYQKGLSIDRIDVNGNYCPENCRWTDSKTQCNNKRNSVKIDVDGDIKTITEWAEYLNINKWKAYYLYVQNGCEFIRMLVRKKRKRIDNSHHMNSEKENENGTDISSKS